jgi:hypothetical protein
VSAAERVVLHVNACKALAKSKGLQSSCMYTQHAAAIATHTNNTLAVIASLTPLMPTTDWQYRQCMQHTVLAK